MLNASTGTPSTTETPQSFGPVTADDFYRASALFSRPLLKPPNRGPNRLVEHCFLTVLRYLDDDDEVFHQTVADEDNLDEEHDDTRGWTRGELLREQSTYLASSLKSALLDMSSLQPEGSDLRLSDTSLRAILRYSSAPATSYSFERSDEWERSSSHSTENWETEDTTIHHLPLTLHPSAHSFLRLLPSFNSLPLTSLNLAYSTVPIEFEKLVNVLPSGLRELGLAGVRVGRGKSDGQNDWRRGLGALARKLIVLRVSDSIRVSWTSLIMPTDARLVISAVPDLRSHPDHSPSATNREAPVVKAARSAWNSSRKPTCPVKGGWFISSVCCSRERGNLSAVAGHHQDWPTALGRSNLALTSLWH